MTAQRFLLAVFVLSNLLTAPAWADDATHVWSESFGDADYQRSENVVVNHFGEVITAGRFEGTVDFGCGPLTSAGLLDVYVAKFDPTGTCIWSKRFGDEHGQMTRHVAVDGSGNVIVVGKFEGTVNFGGDNLESAGADDMFLAKFDSEGAHLWSKRFGDTSLDQVAECVTIDALDNIIITGYFKSAVSFGGATLVSAGGDDIFIAKFYPNGTHVWSYSFGDSEDQQAYAVDVDGQDNILTTGSFEGQVDFGDGSVLTSTGGTDIFLVKHDAAGSCMRSEGFGDSSDNHGGANYGIVIDSLENAVIAGQYQNTVDFGGGTLPSAGLGDVFVAKFDNDINHQWSDNFGDHAFEGAASVTVNSNNDIIVAGYFYSSIDFGGGPLSSAGGTEDIFLACLDASGNHRWSERYGDSTPGANQFSKGVAVDRFDNIVLSGNFDGSIDFGGGPVVSNGNWDVFLTKFYTVREPVIAAIGDVGNDQGRQVRISWRRSYYDAPDDGVDITGYAIFRRQDEYKSADGRSLAAPLFKPDTCPPSTKGWDYVGSVPAFGSETYQYVAPSLCDSTVAGVCYSTFYLSAMTADPLVFFDSAPDSGYSVDNLAPAVPANIHLKSMQMLTWDEPVDEDFNYFSVYGSATDQFDENVVLLGHTVAPEITLDDPLHDYYFVVATDFAGNQSMEPVAFDYRNSVPETLPSRFTLHDNIPNPFNPRTTIHYDLPVRAAVTLHVFDLAGRLVNTLVDGDDQSSGSYAVTWTGRDSRGRTMPSGTYFYRLAAGDYTATKRMTLIR